MLAWPTAINSAFSVFAVKVHSFSFLFPPSSHLRISSDFYVKVSDFYGNVSELDFHLLLADVSIRSDIIRAVS